MNKYSMGIIMAFLLAASFGMGFFAGSHSEQQVLEINEKPVLGVEEKEKVFSDEMQIVYEREYQLCQHLIISDFEHKEDIVGKSLEEIRRLYRPENGYSIKMEGNTLIIHQLINDWCPQDQKKCRLKEYRGRVAIYKGPDAENDALFKVTAIIMESLPEETQKAIKSGKYEFEDEQALNDALENLDEYL